MRQRYSLLLFVVLIGVASVPGMLAQQRQAGPPGAGGAAQSPVLVFKESWKDTAQMMPMSGEFLTNPDLKLNMYGTGKTDFSVTNEGSVPHIWTGDCASACALTLQHKDNFVDLTGKARIRWYSKTSGFHEIRPLLKLADGTYLIGDHVDAEPLDYKISEFYLSEVHWLKMDMMKVVTKGVLLDKVDLSKVDEIGFVDLMPGSGHGSGGYSDMGWIEVYGKAVKR